MEMKAERRRIWVEKHHGAIGWFYIAQQQDRLLEAGEDEGAKIWALVGKRFEEISAETENEVSLN